MDFTVVFDKHTVFNISGNDVKEISGPYSKNELLMTLRDEWVPFMECHGCGRFEYCEFPPKVNGESQRRNDICGQVSKALESFIDASAPFVVEWDKGELQYFLDAAYYFTQYYFINECDNARILSDFVKNSWGEHFSREVVCVTRGIPVLINLQKKMANLPGFGSRQAVLFVEGKSEKVFLEEIKKLIKY